MTDDQTDDIDEQRPGGDGRSLISLLAVVGWIVAAVVAFAQWADVRSDDQDPFTALVMMAPWVIVAMGLTSITRLMD